MNATAKKPAETIAGLSSKAVQGKTGKTWAEWLAVLDKAGCKKMTHKEIVAVIAKKFPNIGGWWTQMVTVGYEQARGLRDKNEKADGYSVNASRTLAVSMPKLFRAWRDEKVREEWLPKSQFRISKATPNQSIRGAWADGKSRLDVNFYSKGSGKNQVTLQHSKLATARDAVRMKRYWAEALDQLKCLLAG